MSENPQDEKKPQLDEATKKALRQLSNLVMENRRRRLAAEVSAPDSGDGASPESAGDEAPDSGAGKPAPTPRDGPWPRRGAEPTRTETLKNGLGPKALDALRRIGECSVWELAGQTEPPEAEGPPDRVSDVANHASSIIFSFFESAFDDGIRDFPSAAWLFGVHASDEVWRLYRNDLAGVWNCCVDEKRADWRSRLSPGDAGPVLRDIDGLRASRKAGDTILFPRTALGERVSLEEIARYQGGPDINGASSSPKDFWGAYAWELLDAAGLTTITDDNPREMIAVHADALAMITDEFSWIADGSPPEDYEYAGYCDCLSIRQMGIVHDFIPPREARAVRNRLHHGDDEGAEAGCGDEEHRKFAERMALATEILEWDRPRVVAALKINVWPCKTRAALAMATGWLPSGTFARIADEISEKLPIDTAPIRDKDGFASYGEWRRFLRDGRCVEELEDKMSRDYDTPLSIAGNWLTEGTGRLNWMMR